jgi:hypothetical protein
MLGSSGVDGGAALEQVADNEAFERSLPDREHLCL